VEKSSGGSVTCTVTYYPGGAMGINISGGSNSVYYLLKDHLGSASVVTDSSGDIVGEQRYYPFGETRLSIGTMYTDKLYTSQREMADLGIYHYYVCPFLFALYKGVGRKKYFYNFLFFFSKIDEFPLYQPVNKLLKFLSHSSPP
jgi:hypothetical protein